MRIAIKTDLPQFSNDIADVVRVFAGEGAAVFSDEEADATLVHRHEDNGGQWIETVCVVNSPIQKRRCAPKVTGGLEEKRLLKRLVKQTCYDVMRVYSGRTPAWGCLTGIRPTRLLYQAMEQGMDLEQAKAWLQREFDLSPAKADLLCEIIQVQTPFLTRDPKRFDLYVGIPFCTTRCSYCSFSSGEIGDGRLVEPYLTALLREVDAASEMAMRYGLTIDTCYIGGGTPSSLRCDQMQRLIDRIEARFPTLCEWTLEAGRPDTLDEEKLRMMRDHPITRISINPQTMNDATLERIGRAHSAKDVLRTYAMARSLGYDDINMDIIAALPGEDLPMFEHTLREIEALGPESLTVHTLAVKRSSRLHEQRYEQSHDWATQMVDAARSSAYRLGMNAYYLYRQKYMADNLENVGYCLPGKVCRYNIDNMEETTSILAVGAGAISKIVLRAEEKIIRVPNIANVEQYIARVEEMMDRKQRAFSGVFAKGGEIHGHH